MPNTDKSAARESLEAILAEHQELMARVVEISEWAIQVDELGDGPKYQELGQQMTELRGLLVGHFAEEEKDGYLASALEVAPRFSQEAAGLLQQHQQFLDRLDRFIGKLQDTDSPFAKWQEAHDEFKNIVAEVLRHEVKENAIVQAAFEDDVGTGD